MTVGERIWQRVQEAAFYGLHSPYSAKEIDRAIRREKAKAWDECCDVLSLTQTDKELARYSNPYRGRKK